VLHRRGGRAAVAVSVGVAGGVPDQRCPTVRSGWSRLLQIAQRSSPRHAAGLATKGKRARLSMRVPRSFRCGTDRLRRRDCCFDRSTGRPLAGPVQAPAVGGLSLARESASELSDRRPDKSSSAGLVRNSCDRPSAGLLPCTSTGSLVASGDTAALLAGVLATERILASGRSRAAVLLLATSRARVGSGAGPAFVLARVCGEVSA
jgi:hypothetical protein